MVSLPYSSAGTPERCAPAGLATAVKPPAMNPSLPALDPGCPAIDPGPPAMTRGPPAMDPGLPAMTRGPPATTPSRGSLCRSTATCSHIAPRCRPITPQLPTAPSTPRTSASCHRHTPSTNSRIQPRDSDLLARSSRGCSQCLKLESLVLFSHFWSV